MSAVADVTPRKQFSILIVELGGMEEIFRALMAAKAVKQLYPECKFHFVVRNGHSTPLTKVEWVEDIIEIPAITSGEDPMKVIALWINRVIDRHYDILCNWTFSRHQLRMSSLVTTLIPAAVKYGNHFRNDFTVGGLDGWTIYREAWLRDHRIDQDIHHIDIITTQLLTALQIHSGDPTPEASTSSVTSRYFFKTSTKVSMNKSASKWIAVHPDSLNARIDEVIDMILRRHPDHGIVILNDTCVGEESGIDFTNPRIVNFSGHLDFETLISVLNSCSWLITGQAPISDLASLLNVRTFYWIESHPSLTEETWSKWTETGPYGNGNIAIRFSADFEPEIFYATWAHYQSEWFHQSGTQLIQHFENLGISGQTEGLEVFKSRIRSANEGGGVSFESVLLNRTDFSQWMFRIRGQVARSWFCGWVPPIENEIEKLTLHPELVKRMRELKESISVIERVSQQAKEVAKDLHDTAINIRNPRIMSVEDRNQIDSCGKKLLELESLISRVVNIEPELRCFHVWYQHLMHNLEGDTIEQMAIETSHAFDLLLEGAGLVHSYVEKALIKAKPKAVVATLSEQVSPLKED